MKAFLGKIGGRKFVMAVFAVIAIVLGSLIGIDATPVMAVGGIVCTFIFSQGLADGLSKGKTSTTVPDE